MPYNVRTDMKATPIVRRLITTLMGSFLLLLGSCAGAELVLTSPDHPQSAGAIWNGEVDERWYDTAQDTYELSTAQQLAGLATLVNRGVTMRGKKVFLSNDIYLNKANDYTIWDDVRPANRWTPIGMTRKAWDFSCAFKGEFDGNGHRIEGMYIDDAVLDSLNSDWSSCGLFGAVDLQGDYARLAVKNVSIYKSFIGVNQTSKRAANVGAAVGAIVGGGRYGRINGIANVFCQCDFTIGSATVWMGGVVGLSAANCFNCGYVGDIVASTDLEFVGGVAGGGGKPAYVVNSYSTLNMSSLWKKQYNCGAITSSCVPLYSYYLKNQSTNTSNFAYGSARRIENDKTLYAEGNGYFASASSEITIGSSVQKEFQNAFVFGDNRKDDYVHLFEHASIVEALNAFGFEGIFDRTAEDDAWLAEWKPGTNETEGYPVL